MAKIVKKYTVTVEVEENLGASRAHQYHAAACQRGASKMFCGEAAGSTPAAAARKALKRLRFGGK
jgi:hypothetical protein